MIWSACFFWTDFSFLDLASCTVSVSSFSKVRYSFLLFFFSSRRRHTRCLSDWSSDVCSSDLSAALFCTDENAHLTDLVQSSPISSPPLPFLRLFPFPAANASPIANPLLLASETRSEERRVGKEGRSRGCEEDYKEKRYQRTSQ